MLLSLLIVAMGLNTAQSFILQELSKLDNDSAEVVTKCPTWYSPSEHNPRECVCDNVLEPMVKCHRNHQVLVRNIFCMSYNETSQQPLVGNCPFVNIENKTRDTYFLQSENVSELNEQLCGWANREGFMCTKCKEGLGISVMTYDKKCVKCIGKLKGWILYLFLATVPTTLFFFLVIGCRIKTTTEHFNWIIGLSRMFIFYIDKYPNSLLSTSSNYYFFSLIAVTVSGVWSLDFFRYVIPPFCITETLSNVEVTAMEYIVAVYPLVLIITTYICIELHDRGCKVLVIIWTPFRWCARRASWNIDLRTSIVEAFASFLLLTCAKFIFVSYNLLGFTPLLDMSGQKVGPYVTKFDATVPYLSNEHLPYFILSIAVLSIFVMFPILVLCLYPTMTFQRVLGSIKWVQWHPLHAFADAYNGCYKNGTEGTRDCRCFGGLYLLLHLLYHAVAVTWRVNSSILLIIIPAVASLLISTVRPYKNNFYNVLDSVIFCGVALMRAWLAYHMYVAQLSLGSALVGIILPSLPVAHMVIIVIYKLLSLCAPAFLGRMKLRVKLLARKMETCVCGGGLHIDQTVGNEAEDEEEDNELPDRIRNPAHYHTLIEVPLVQSLTYGIETVQNV